MQDGQNGPIANGVQKLVGVPGGGQRARLGLAIAHGDRDQELWIVEGGTKGVGECIAEFAAFVDRARGLGRAVATDAAGKRKLFE